jgi:hypothetical protein
MEVSPSRLIPEKVLPVFNEWELGWAQSWSGRCGEEENLSPLPEIEFRPSDIPALNME